ncbi:hypothetical protein C1645_829345, partial [Glomus cerebriforme]
IIQETLKNTKIVKEPIKIQENDIIDNSRDDQQQILTDIELTAIIDQQMQETNEHQEITNNTYADDDQFAYKSKLRIIDDPQKDLQQYAPMELHSNDLQIRGLLLLTNQKRKDWKKRKKKNNFKFIKNVLLNEFLKSNCYEFYDYYRGNNLKIQFQYWKILFLVEGLLEHYDR